MVVLAVMIWWIVCLWIDEPGAGAVIASDVANAPVAAETLDAGSARLSDSDAEPEE
jgi:hypothetical protein